MLNQKQLKAVPATLTYSKTRRFFIQTPYQNKEQFKCQQSCCKAQAKGDSIWRMTLKISKASH
jgi:hypothetical protein